jgi:hypothetical protein
MVRPTKDAAVPVERANSRRTNNARPGLDVASPTEDAIDGSDFVGRKQIVSASPLVVQQLDRLDNETIDIKKRKSG